MNVWSVFQDMVRVIVNWIDQVRILISGMLNEDTDRILKWAGFLIGLLIAVILVLGIITLLLRVRRAGIKRKLYRLARNGKKITPQKFLGIVNRGRWRRKSIPKECDFEGAYVLYNQTGSSYYYIGSGKRVIQRICDHFVGLGNWDVYKDYKRGDSFTIQIFPLKGSNYNSPKALRRHIASTYNSNKIRQLADDEDAVTPQQFFEMKNLNSGRYGQKYDFEGVYLICNHTKGDKYYVGQSVHVIVRVNQHFTGRGNGDVYEDYKNGDRFTITMIKLRNSNCRSLNELERESIRTYDAYNRGYNKTRGNAG
ncbi:MAG: GIY-YIG nuclease family protein [Clostridiales bacterium]|nr:GIY-YIG nuclease family protein [Clostridiales bacterium]